MIVAKVAFGVCLILFIAPGTFGNSGDIGGPPSDFTSSVQPPPIQYGPNTFAIFLTVPDPGTDEAFPGAAAESSFTPRPPFTTPSPEMFSHPGKSSRGICTVVFYPTVVAHYLAPDHPKTLVHC